MAGSGVVAVGELMTVSAVVMRFAVICVVIAVLVIFVMMVLVNNVNQVEALKQSVGRDRWPKCHQCKRNKFSSQPHLPSSNRFLPVPQVISSTCSAAGFAERLLRSKR